MTMVSAAVWLALAGALVSLGRWGAHNSHRMPISLPERERERRSRVMRSGAKTCYAVAVMFAAAATATVILPGS